MPHKPPPPVSYNWTPSEVARRKVVEAGGAVLANQAYDKALIAWAAALALYARVDRDSIWADPFPPQPGDTLLVAADRYRAYLAGYADLLRRLPSLRGKVLGCWCYPSHCHGDVLLELLGDSDDTVKTDA